MAKKTVQRRSERHVAAIEVARIVAVIAAVVACVPAAVRAMRVDPVEGLRAE